MTDMSAAEYVLGILEEEEAASFTQRLLTDAELREEVRRAAEELSAAPSALPLVAPPPRLKARVLASIRKPPPSPGGRGQGLGAIRAGEGKWRPTGMPGVTFKKLYFDRASGLLTTLVRLEPGASMPAHRHSVTEQCLIVEGDLIHDGHVYGPGDFTWAEAGSVDPSLHTRAGALLLIVGGKETETVP